MTVRRARRERAGVWNADETWGLHILRKRNRPEAQVVLGQVHDEVVQGEAIPRSRWPATFCRNDFGKNAGQLNRFSRAAVTLDKEREDTRLRP
ncbi:hypothetical protein GCM10010256_78480 [Streptomyces coeruleorubidus]|nr:hypothetical protein GCM10010256_78480 [Streptomyces coeruleorubidus]